MPDQVTTSSLISLSTQAPGGLQIATTQNTANYTIPQLIALFGTNNVKSVGRNVTQNINEVSTQETLTELNVVTTTQQIQGRTTIVPQITRLSEREFNRGEILALFTASRPAEAIPTITGSFEIVVDPERQLSRDPDIRALFEDTGVLEDGKAIERHVPQDLFNAHIANREFEITDFYTHSESTIEMSDYGYIGASDAVADEDNGDDKYTTYYIQNDTMYLDNRHVSLYQGDEHKYFKISGSDEAWGITSRGKTFHTWVPGQKEKPKIRLIFEVTNKKMDPAQVCVDGQNPKFETAYWFDREFYREKELITPFFVSDNGTEYIKNVTWDEAMLIDTSGSLSASAPC